MKRTKDILNFMMHMKQYKDWLKGIPLDQWLIDDRNIALVDDEGDDYALFELFEPSVYTGHYFFNCKGKIAKDNALEAIEYMFTEMNAEVLRGLTPIENKAARWMSRQIGFKSYDIIDTDTGPHEVFILTKKEWETSQ